VATKIAGFAGKALSKPKHYSFCYRIVVLTIMLIFIFCQYYFSWLENNLDRSALFENWESDFFQMRFYVVLTIKLRQVGSSESKKLAERIPGRYCTPEYLAPAKRGFAKQAGGCALF